MIVVNLKLYAWTVRGKQRIAVVKALNHVMTPSQVRKTCRQKQYHKTISLSNTCDILRNMAKEGIAICLNPDAKIGRLYQLTEEGEKIRQELMKEYINN